MKIAILAWGSLINDSTGLSLATEWTRADLSLPLEFSRVSHKGNRAGCLTLVIDPANGVDCPVFFAESELTNLNEAIDQLGERERVSYKSSVGYVNIKHGHFNTYAMRWYPEVCTAIMNWARANEYDAVIWANFKSNYEEEFGIEFSDEHAMEYLNGLQEPQKTNAFQYIQSANEVIDTPLRRLVIRQLAQGRAAVRRRRAH